MLRPAMSEMLDNDQDYYNFVVSVARRAREIAIEAEENKVFLAKKPVKLAVEEFAAAAKAKKSK